MTSIFAAAMGEEFERLHPMLQRRFGVGLDAGYACIGRGTMTRIRRGPWWTIPFLQFGRLRNILVPSVGTNLRATPSFGGRINAGGVRTKRSRSTCQRQERVVCSMQCLIRGRSN